MDHRQSVVLLLLLLVLAGVSAWLRFGLLADPDPGTISAAANAPDYYIENFTSTGLDRAGKKYQITADRLVHHPLDDRALLERPHIIQYHPDRAPRHIHANAGWLYDDRAEIALSGNVRVIDNPTGAGGGVETITNTMLVRLKDEDG